MDDEKLNRKLWRYFQVNTPSTVVDAANSLAIDRRYCQKIVNFLLAQGCLSIVKGKGTRYDPKLYRVVPDNEPTWETDNEPIRRRKRRYKKTTRQKLWNNMKIEQVFTAHSLISSINVSINSSNRFIRSLYKAGYLICVCNGKKVKSSHRGTEKSRYRLVRDTGRLAPIVRDNGVWDQNQQRFYKFNPDFLSRKTSLKETQHDVAR